MDLVPVSKTFAPRCRRVSPRRFLLSSLTLLLLAAPVSAQFAFRFVDLDLKDPHAYVPIPLLGCNDVTNSVPLDLAPSFNEQLEESVTLDGNGDGALDLNAIVYFFPPEVVVGSGPPAWEQNAFQDGPGGLLAFHFGTCTAPLASTVCDADAENPVYRVRYVNETSGECFAPIPGTLRPYTPALLIPDAPCFATDPFDADIDIGGVLVPLGDVRLAAKYIGNPAGTLVSGVIQGFLPEASAEATILPSSVPFVGGEPLSSILPGGAGCCAGHDDRDLGPDGSTLGWWIYFNFRAEAVPFTAATFTPEVAGASADEAPALGRGTPNPFRGTTRLSYSLRTPGRVSVGVWDVRGRRVATLFEGRQPAGAHVVSWAGTERSGRPAAGGVYFVRVETDTGTRSRKVVLAR